MKLNLGSGFLGADSLWADWLNADFAAFEEPAENWDKAEFINFDFREHWPLEDSVADCIFASHVFEHIEYEKIPLFVGEIARVLKPGAPFRIICPDPRAFIRNWQMGNEQYIKDCYGLENWERWDYEHNTHIGFTDMFFPEHYAHAIVPSLDMTMLHFIRAGFDPVQEMNFGNTMFPEFYGTDQPDEWPATMDNRPGMSWYLEGVK